MSALETLTELIQQGRGAPEGVLRKAVDALFGERYQRSAGKDAQIRDAYALAREDAEAGIPWAGLINPDNPNSGPYGGTSLVWFPGESTALIGFGVGTRGISPDEGILTRPGHRRRVAALRRLLAKKGVMIWSKADPAALGVSVPKTFSSQFPEFAGTFKRYANEMYCVAQVPSEPKLAEDVVRAFLDLYAFERDWPVLKAYAERVRSQLLRVGQTEIVATELIRIATRLLDALVDVQPKKPRSHELDRAGTPRLLENAVRNGLQALGWVVDERGLGGGHEMDGLAWQLPLEQLWERYVEAKVRDEVGREGGDLSVGRLGQTVFPLHWSTNTARSMTHLIPDIAVRRGRSIRIVDAKYKAHFADIDEHMWMQLSNDIRDAHRSDVHQVLAYASLYDAEDVTATLVYPLRLATWEALHARQRDAAFADLFHGSRRVRLELQGARACIDRRIRQSRIRRPSRAAAHHHRCAGEGDGRERR